MAIPFRTSVDGSSNNVEQLIAIVGPTGSGKTGVSLDLAREKKISGAVISADSRQVYVGMDIGTAKIVSDDMNPEALKGKRNTKYTEPVVVKEIDHYLLSISDVLTPLSLADWQAAAFEVIDQVLQQKQTPLLVGGTMLYVDSIVNNYALPQVPPNQKWREAKAELVTSELYAELIRLDPAAGEFVQQDNKRRIIRALEVIEATGRPFSAQRLQRPLKYKVKMVGIFPGWDRLLEQIAHRARKMLDDGLLDETRGLRDTYGKDVPLLQTINYKQAGNILDGELTPAEGQKEMIKVTMRYAKRQMGWWRGRQDIKWFDPSQLAEIIRYCTT